MNNIYLSILIVLVMMSLQVFGQVSTDYGQLSQYEKQYTSYGKDTSVHAIYLLHAGNLTFDEDMGEYEHIEYFHHDKIKILDKEGFRHGDIELYFYSKDRLEFITNLKAQIIQPDGSIQKLKESDFITLKQNDFWSKVVFAFPNIQVGSVLEYTYLLESEYIVSNRYWYFQKDLPIVYGSFDYKPAVYYNYNILFYPGGGLRETYNNIETKDKYQRDTVIYKKDDYTLKVVGKSYVATNAPPIKEEPFITTVDDYKSKIVFQLRSYFLPTMEKAFVAYSSWPNLAKRLGNLTNFGKQITRKGRIKPIIDDFEVYVAAQGKTGTTDIEEKAKLIYDFINFKVKWNNEFRARLKEDVHLVDIYRKGSGSSGALNLMFLALCKAQKIPYKAVLLSTRTNGLLSTKTPVINQFNHVLTLLELNGKVVLVDVSGKEAPFGEIRFQCINGYGWIVDQDKNEWVKLLGTENYQKVNTNIHMKDSINYKMRVVESGYYASDIRRELLNETNEKVWNKRLNVSESNILLTDIELKNKRNTNEPITSTLSFVHEDDINASTIIFNPFPYFKINKNPFTSSFRHFALDFGNPFFLDYNTTIKLDEKYEIVEIPSDLALSVDEDLKLIYKVVKNRNTILIRLQLVLSKPIISADKYQSVKGIFEQMVLKINENIILKKSNP